MRNAGGEGRSKAKQYLYEKMTALGLFVPLWMVLCALVGLVFIALTGYPYYFVSNGVEGSRCMFGV